MTDFRKIFAEKGYSLFEADSVEKAIIDSIKNGEHRYILGIPVIIENSKLDYGLLIQMARKEGKIPEVLGILKIASKIIKDSTKRKEIEASINWIGKPKRFDETEFKSAYLQAHASMHSGGFGGSLNYQLTQIFAPKQIKIIYKLKNGEKLGKTEREYFSRVIKKRLVAIRELNELADGLVG